MEDKSSLRLGLEAALRHPVLWLLVLAWDLSKWGLGLLGDQFGFGWIRLDYNIGYQPTAAGPFFVRMMLPPALPSAEPLGASFGGQPPDPMSWDWVLVSAAAIVVITLVEPLLRAGYLNLLNGSIRGVKPGMAVFWRGVRRFGLAQVLLTLLWWPVSELQNVLAGSAVPWMAQAVLVVAVLAFYMAQYVIVTDDANVLQAFFAAPVFLVGHLGSLLVPVFMSALITGAITGVLSWAGAIHPLVLIPLYAIIGTGLATSMLAAVQEGIGVRTEPGMPWACRDCRAQNDIGRLHCVVCGRPMRKDEVRVATTEQQVAAAQMEPAQAKSPGA